MGCNKNGCCVQGNDRTVGSINADPDWGSMAKEDRKQQVLRILDESDLALTPYVIFRNLRMQGATFERRTLTNYLTELLDEGRVRKIEISDGDTLYQITKSGRDSIKEESDY